MSAKFSRPGETLKSWLVDNARGWLEAPAPKAGIKARFNWRIFRWLGRK